MMYLISLFQQSRACNFYKCMAHDPEMYSIPKHQSAFSLSLAVLLLYVSANPKHLKREELEANGEEGTKYRKEPSACPICGKVL